MEMSGFSSDSTYYSLHENKEPGKRKKESKKDYSKIFLRKVHKAVILHLEGETTIRRAKLIQYMKLVEKLKLTNPKRKCLAEKIQASLFKIYSLTKPFQSSIAISDTSPQIDSIETFPITPDIKLDNGVNDDPKQILMKTTSVNDENESFPLEMLTNFDTFMNQSSQIGQTTNHFNVDEKLETESFVVVSDKANSMSFDLFSLQDSDVLLKSYSSSWVDSLNKTVQYPEENAVADSNQNNTLINLHISTSSVVCPSNAVDNIKENGQLEVNNIRNLDKPFSPQQILKLCEGLSVKPGPLAMEIPDTTNPKNNNCDTTARNLNLKSVMDLGNMFNESINKKMYNLCSGTGNNLSKRKSWQDIDIDVRNTGNLAKSVHNTLEELFEKLQLEDCNMNRITDKILTKGNIHNFNEEDNKNLDVEELMNTNRDRLEQICEEFQVHVTARQKEVTEDDDFEIINWKDLMK